MSNALVRLSVNASAGQKAAVSVVGLLFLAVLGGIAAVVASMLDFPDTSGGGGLPETVVTAIFGLIMVVMLGFVATMVAGTYLRQAVLDGTVLRVRGLLGTREADLATTRVWVGSEPEYVTNPHGEGTVPTGRRVPHLVAEDPRSGRKLRLRLHTTARTLLPPHELRALAGAVESGRRGEPEASQASATALLLRRLADDPIARLL
ncbi:hypothetical protein [Sphaerisporangium fuscum]|uniref:hypothetical protein n=1 Tax=Sphaerisporangium fuscum TaxID=2835868 RepID=UPI001BDD14D6|nr:hypothetical protein [Sphaerisporangium fuscum]